MIRPNHPTWAARAFLALTLAVMPGMAVLPVHASGAQPGPAATEYWHTAGTAVVDGSGRPVHINGVNWYGMNTAQWVPAGLNFQRYTTIMDLVKVLGFNTIRLPFSNELVERNPIVRGGLAANPRLRGLRALQVMDAIANYARRIGLKIILDDHYSSAPRPFKVNNSYEPLWYTPQYPESSWIHDWQMLALRYRGNDAVVGFDLRNEPHTSGPGPWNLNAYLTRSATWGPFRGVENRATDWRLAAERAGDSVLAVNPRLLIIVQGLPLYPDANVPAGVTSSWWAGILSPVRRFPVQLRVAHQLVYSVHEWGPRKGSMPWFSHMTYASLTGAWRRNWSFILDHPAASYAAPILLGEFGTCTESAACARSSVPGSQGAWFQMMLRYLHQNPELGWSFYALNGTNANDCRADNGLLNWAWNNVSSRPLQVGLRSIQATPGLLPASLTRPVFPGTYTGRRPRSSTSRLCLLP